MRHRLFALAGAALLAAAGASGIKAADSSGADLASALLVAEDLHADLAPSGVTDEPAFDYDEASFDASGGLDKAAQTWQATEVVPDSPVLVVFDFRFLFPSAVAAQGYLDAAEPILSESVTGITLQPDTAAVGEVLRHYAGSLSGGDVTIDVQNFLFRVGPVVAKVYVGGFGTTLDDALPIAQAAATRIDAWLSAQPSSSPSVSSTPEASVGAVGSVLRQWASSATASSEYGSDSWSALQATGEPDVTVYSDDPDAWAPGVSDGTIEWLELTYAQAVIPSAVTIVESFGSGAVTLVEAFDPATGEWLELWSGEDPSADALTALSPPIAAVTFATDRLRITLDTGLAPGWNEIDAVELVGAIP